MVREANGQYDSIRARFVGAVISVVAMSYNFLTREKHSIRFIETLRNYQQRKPLQKDLQNGTVFICRFNFRQHFGHSRCYIHFGGSFFLSLAGGRHVLFSHQFSAVYLSFDIQSTCSFNTYGYHFSFHRCMMKELTIVSNPDFQFQHSTIFFRYFEWKLQPYA